MKVNFTYKSREQNYTDRTKKKKSVPSKIYNGKSTILHQVTVLPSKLNDICITTVTCINVRTLIESDYV